MSFKDILGKAFPFLSIAASAGGPLGSLAVNLIGKAVGVKNAPATPDKLTDFLSQALADPEQMSALRKVDDDFQAQMAQLGYHDAETFEQYALEDRESARQREVSVRDYTPEIGFYLLIGVFLYIIHYLVRYPVPTENRAMVYSAVGSIGTLLVTAATYFYGTTRGSENKGATLAGIAQQAVSSAAQPKATK